MNDFVKQAAYDFFMFYDRREADRWALADICALISEHPMGLRAFKEELAEQHGIAVNLQTLKNHARVSKSFGQEHRHHHLKWSYYLEWSKHPDPVGAMKIALDDCYSPSQMRNLRLYSDPNHKKDKVCEGCGESLKRAHTVCEKCLGHSEWPLRSQARRIRNSQ